MAAIDTIIAKIQDCAEAAGARFAPDFPPEQTAAFPFAVTYPSRATWDIQGGGWMKGLVTVRTEIHVARKDLARDVERVNIFAQAFPNELWSDPTLGGNVDTIIQVRQVAFGPLAWAGQDTIGYTFETDFKVMPAIT
jgi:hypothetical protein